MSLTTRIFLFLVDIAQTLLIAGVLFLIIYKTLVAPFQVNGQSMFPNFHDGEYVLTNLIGFEDLFVYKVHFGKLKLGDVVVFKAPPDPSKDYIKRVIGVAGDTVMIQNGDVYLNGKLLDQSSFLGAEVKTYGGAFMPEGVTKTVPQGNYFVMGDNRGGSSDSREWGFVPQDVVIGTSMLVYWPVNEVRIVKNPYTKQ